MDTAPKQVFDSNECLLYIACYQHKATKEFLGLRRLNKYLITTSFFTTLINEYVVGPTHELVAGWRRGCAQCNVQPPRRVWPARHWPGPLRRPAAASTIYHQRQMFPKVIVWRIPRDVHFFLFYTNVAQHNSATSPKSQKDSKVLSKSVQFFRRFAYTYRFLFMCKL